MAFLRPLVGFDSSIIQPSYRYIFKPNHVTICVLYLFLAASWVCLGLIVAFPGHTYLPFGMIQTFYKNCQAKYPCLFIDPWLD